ncbi:MAG TPA: hypothetical protein VE967_16135 [Gemmatimonadaceae bacterium]|nr:hypothetical protein [Gemmatimonadaceae bacterium]
MPALSIRIKKGTDGSAALTCTRADGSVTWQQQKGQHGVFFPLHDLTHYAVETVLGVRRGFYGLLADGWDISDFQQKGAAKKIPVEGGWVELVVGFLDAERAAGVPWTADDLRDKVELYYSDHGGGPAPHTVTDDELNAIRDRRRELFSAWSKVQPGSALELEFRA